MSRGTGRVFVLYFYRERNRLSILLALLRRHLRSTEFRRLLRLQLCVDRWLSLRRVPEKAGRLWVTELGRFLDRIFERLGTKKLSRKDVAGLFHVLSDLFRL